MKTFRSVLVYAGLVALLFVLPPVAMTGCSRPVTIESVQQDVPTTGTKLLRAMLPVQDAIYESVKAKVLTPAQGIKYLDVTQKIGETGQKVAANLDRLDLIIASGQAVEGTLITEILAGLGEMTNQYPALLSASLPPQVSTAVSEAQKLIQTLQDTVNKIRAERVK